MPVFLLCIQGELENIKQISIRPDHRFCFSVKESAGSETKDRVYVTAAEEVELSGSKGKANLALKFAKDARREATMVVEPVKGVTRSVTGEDDRKMVPIMAFDCRGLEPTEFFPEDGWVVETASGRVFDDVDLSSGEWCEYDEKLGESVGIYEFSSELRLHRGK